MSLGSEILLDLYLNDLWTDVLFTNIKEIFLKWILPKVSRDPCLVVFIITWVTSNTAAAVLLDTSLALEIIIGSR